MPAQQQPSAGFLPGSACPRLGEIKSLDEVHDVVGRVLKPKEKLRLFQVARSREEWQRAYLCAVVGVNTSGRKIEILSSRLEDVDFFDWVWTVRKSKTAAGVRRIDLNDEALSAFGELKRIVELLGG